MKKIPLLPCISLRSSTNTSRHDGAGAVPAIRLQSGQLLPVARSARALGAEDAKSLKELELENHRLRRLLAER